MILSSENFKYELIERLKTVKPLYKESNIRYAIRCPLCGDSRRNAKRTRFYIKCDPSNLAEPVLYKCFNCGESGILTPSVLKKLDFNDMPLMAGLRAYNKTIEHNFRQRNKYNSRLDLKVPKPDETIESNVRKKEYFEERLGVKVTFDEMRKFKCIFRLGDFLMVNKIEMLTVSAKKALDIHENYLGFLTMNNESINARQVISEQSEYRRYEKYSLADDVENRLGFYSIPTVIDILTTDTITINLAEGVFDIFGVYYHVDTHHENTIYVAVCGSSYRRVIEYFIERGFVCNVVLNIYADTDQDIEIYRSLKKEFGVWFDEFNVYTNGIAKDFGVPKQHINRIKNKV